MHREIHLNVRGQKSEVEPTHTKRLMPNVIQSNCSESKSINMLITTIVSMSEINTHTKGANSLQSESL